jgi:hypothetical protein
MRINELLVESQLDEGPFTQAVGKVGGKIAKGISNVGKDLKTGFKAGFGGDKTADTTPKKPGLLQKIGQAATDFTQGFQQGAGQAAPANTGTTATTTTPAADPAAEKQSKIGVGQINKIIPTLRTRDLMSLQANLEKTIASKKKAPAVEPAATQQQTAPAVSQSSTDQNTEPSAKKPRVKKAAAPTQAEIDADRARLMGPNSESTVKQGRVVAESFSLYRKQ